MGNALKGLGSGLAGLVGLGSFYNPVASAQAKVQEATQNLNNMVAQESLLGLQTLQKEVGVLYDVMTTNKAQMNTVIKKNQDFVSEEFKEENYFLILLSAFVFIIYIYILIQS